MLLSPTPEMKRDLKLVKRAIEGAECGKLVDFELFRLIAAVVWFRTRERRLTGDRLSEFKDFMEWSELADAEQFLMKWLIEVIIRLDTVALRQVTDTVEHLRNYHLASDDEFAPFNDEHFAPFDRGRRALLRYFLLHESGTIEELLSWMNSQIDWNVNDADLRARYDKWIRRACKHYRLPIKASRPGPRAS